MKIKAITIQAFLLAILTIVAYLPLCAAEGGDETSVIVDETAEADDETSEQVMLPEADEDEVQEETETSEQPLASAPHPPVTVVSNPICDDLIARIDDIENMIVQLQQTVDLHAQEHQEQLQKLKQLVQAKIQELGQNIQEKVQALGQNIQGHIREQIRSIPRMPAPVAVARDTVPAISQAKVQSQAPAVVQQAPAVKSQAPAVKSQAPAVVQQTPAPTKAGRRSRTRSRKR